MPKKVIILKGLPASGKSTWAKDKVSKSQGSYKRVNKDDLRAMIDNGKYSKGNEKFVLQMRDMLITHALGEGKHVIVDDTNLHPTHEEQIRLLVQGHNRAWGENVVVEIKTFDLDVETCIERDLQREASVGAEVILKMARQHLPGYDRTHVPEIDMEKARGNDLPWCIIYDLDGTAAIMGDRSPYDASRCDEVDRCNHALHALLNMCEYGVGYNPEWDVKFIAMSGRGSEYREPTARFIEKHNFPCDYLYMRKEGDARKDAIIKGELYEEHIKGKYNVLVVFDDRNQMIDYWRKEAKLPCFQVNYGDF